MCDNYEKINYLELNITNVNRNQLKKENKTFLEFDQHVLEIEIDKYLNIVDEGVKNVNKNIKQNKKKQNRRKRNFKENESIQHNSQNYSQNKSIDLLDTLNFNLGSQLENLNSNKEILNYVNLNKCKEKIENSEEERAIKSTSTVDTINEEKKMLVDQEHNLINSTADEKTNSEFYMCIRPIRKNKIYSKNKTKFTSSNLIYSSITLNKTFPKDTLINPKLMNEIYFNLILEEKKQNLVIFEKIEKIQTDINDKMRAVLVDWLIDVHVNFRLNAETLFLCLNIIDKYLSIKLIDQNNFQLLGVTALWLACKYQEVSVPLIKDCEYVTANAYSREEIKNMERDILKTLEYEITFPSSLLFYELLAVNFGFSEIEYFQGRYLMESFLLDLRIRHYQPHLLACAVTYLVMKLSIATFPEYSLIKYYTLEEEKVMKECARDIIYVIENSNMKSVKNKFSHDDYFKVALGELLKQNI